MYYKSVCAFVYRALNFIKRILHGSSNSTSVRKSLYLSLVRSKLSYCSQLWRPYLIKDIVSLENIQRRASKFIANDYSISYRNRHITLQMLPLMYWLELHDLIFMVKCLQSPCQYSQILSYVSFVISGTRQSTKHHLATNHSILGPFFIYILP